MPVFTAGVLSDTHGYVDDHMLKHLSGADEIWHAGDFGGIAVADRLQTLGPLRGVYGNIDGQDIRQVFPEFLSFECAGIRVLMTHIGGNPSSYPAQVRNQIRDHRPDLFICGHSHILKVAPAASCLHLNPGAAGRHGFHHVRTMVLLTIDGGKIRHLDVVELGPRSEKFRSADPIG